MTSIIFSFLARARLEPATKTSQTAQFQAIQLEYKNKTQAHKQAGKKCITEHKKSETLF